MESERVVAVLPSESERMGAVGSKEGKRPRVLVIAGYDQSGGAGVLADVKTLEAHRVYGFAVCTALTFQNERRISRVEWLSESDIFEQIDLCLEGGDFEWVKMGITQSMGSAAAIVGHLKRRRPDVRVVLDPVIRASSGRDFWAANEGWEELARKCFLVTPNWEEIGELYAVGEEMECCRMLSGMGPAIYLKGGHHPDLPGRDYLWSGGEVKVLEGDVGVVYPKHGSGCVLASSLTANLALGHSVFESAVRAKRYTYQFLRSNKTLLGWH
jgi:hydroxymethylpyrimidine/phosphomethylpyrimidine kinase